MNDETNKRLAEIKARSEAAGNYPQGYDAFHARCGQDVPFLLKELEQAQMDFAAAAEATEVDLKEILRLKSALAASEAAAWKFRDETERLRIDLVAAKGAAKILGTAADHSVSEEECARRCREVAMQFLGAATGSEPRLFTSELADLDAIIERVSKGGAQ